MGRHGFMTALRKPQCAVTVSYGAPETTMGRCGFIWPSGNHNGPLWIHDGPPETTMGRHGFIWPSGNHNGPLWFHDGPPETTMGRYGSMTALRKPQRAIMVPYASPETMNRLWAVEEQLLEGHRAESLSWEAAAKQWAVGVETFASVVAMEGVASSAVAEDERPMAERQAAEATRARPSSEGDARTRAYTCLLLRCQPLPHRSPGSPRPSQAAGSNAVSGLSGWRAYPSAVACSSASQSAFKIAARTNSDRRRERAGATRSRRPARSSSTSTRSDFIS